MVSSLPAGMTEFEGMCTMPMMAAECAYSSYTDFISEPKGIMDSDVDYYPNVEALEPHFHEPIGQVRTCPLHPLLLHSAALSLFSCAVQIQRQFLTRDPHDRWSRFSRLCNQASGRRS